MSDIDFPVFTAMLRDVLKGHLRDSSTFLHMIAEDVVIEYPYAETEPRVIKGRAAMREHFRRVSNLFAIDKAEAVTVCSCTSTQTTFIEFDLSGKWLKKDLRFEQRDVCVVEISDGSIIRYREYWNPLLSYAEFWVTVG